MRNDPALPRIIDNLKAVRTDLRLNSTPSTALSLAIARVDEAILCAQSEYVLGND